MLLEISHEIRVTWNSATEILASKRPENSTCFLPPLYRIKYWFNESLRGRHWIFAPVNATKDQNHHTFLFGILTKKSI